MSDEWMEKAICRDRLAPQNIFVVQNNKKVFVILPQRLEIFYLDNLFELEPSGNKSNQCVFYLLYVGGRSQSMPKGYEYSYLF